MFSLRPILHHELAYLMISADQMIGVVHRSRMDGEPIDHADVFVVSANNFQHRHQSVCVVLRKEKAKV